MRNNGTRNSSKHDKQTTKPTEGNWADVMSRDIIPHENARIRWQSLRKLYYDHKSFGMCWNLPRLLLSIVTILCAMNTIIYIRERAKRIGLDGGIIWRL